ncbi:MAG TPA: helix-turn-helix domain-containing protein [Acidimicrobiales bacterium]|nr:helix-turn-helix domain-containing protein [Acidimicrobiales bacterium]
MIPTRVVEWSTKCCFWANFLVKWVIYGARPIMNQERSKRLGEFLRARREELGLSARHLARAVGVRDSTIMRLERGAYAAPAADKLARITEQLNLELADVFALAEYAVPSSLPALPHYVKLRYPSLEREAIDQLHELLQQLLGSLPSQTEVLIGERS